MNQVIITGASGLLGAELAKAFKDRKYEVIGVFNNKPELINSDIEKVQCDISNVDSVMSLSNIIKPSALIVHCAAITNVGLCEKNKELCYAVNVMGTQNICDLAIENNSKLIYISTASVFDGGIGNYKEEDKTSAVNYYNESKIEGENEVLKYDKGIVVRTIPLGIHPAGRNVASFLEWLVGAFKNNEDINLFTDVKINPLTISTLAKLIIQTSSLVDKGIIHLGSKDNVSKADIGLEVKKFFPNYSGNLNLASIDDMVGDGASRPKEMWINVDKAISLGFDLPDALADINQYLNGKELL